MKPSEGFVLGSNPSEHRLYALLLFVLLSFSAPTLRAAEPPSTLLLTHKSKIWRIDTNGVAEPMKVKFEGGNDIDHQGTSSPVSSPNQEFIAYTKANDLWIMDLRNNTSTRATHFGRRGTADTAAVYVLTTAWSFDSREVLYYLAHAEAETFEHNKAKLEVVSAPYGYRIYDLATKKSRAVKFPGQYETWLADGDFLLTSTETDMFDQRLLRFRTTEELPQLVSPLKGWWGQTSMSKDGKNLLIAFSQPVTPNKDESDKEADSPRMTSRIFKLNLKTNTFSDVSPVGFWSEYQMPTYSPSGRKIAYIQQQEMDEAGYIRGKLVVDGQSIADFPAPPFEYHWVNDQAIALIQDSTAVVVDSSTGKELGHTHLVDVDTTETTSGQ